MRSVKTRPEDLLSITLHVSELPASLLDDDSLLTDIEVSDMTHLARSTLARDRQLGQGIPYTRINEAIRYRRGDVRAAIRENMVKTTDG